MENISALVTLHVAKAYDSVEYEILLERLMACNVPPYIMAWLQEFLRGREFFVQMADSSPTTFQRPDVSLKDPFSHQFPSIFESVESRVTAK